MGRTNNNLMIRERCPWLDEMGNPIDINTFEVNEEEISMELDEADDNIDAPMALQRGYARRLQLVAEVAMS